VKIDAHQHFWRYSEKEYGWIDDSMAVLREDFLPDRLEKILHANNYAGSIAVQARQSLEETAWLLELAEKHSRIKGVVGWLDLRSDNISEQLEKFATHPKLAGVRHVVQDEPDDNFLLRDDFMRGIQKLLNYDLAYDILIFPKQLPAAIEFVKSFPQHRFVLNHIAKPLIKDGLLSPWKEHLQELATFKNVYCKISGMVTEADWTNWSDTDFSPYLDTVIEAFGMNRLMFGSDWPVCTVAASYERVIKIVDDHLEKRSISISETEAFWGANAVDFYKLKSNTI
jgi:L-fuconolactonase